MRNQPINQSFVGKLERGLSNLRAISYLSIIGGVFALVFMLLMALQEGTNLLNLAHISFLVGGAIAFAIGIGLLNYSEAARQAGSMWFLAWGVVNLVVGFAAAWQGQMLIGIFCMCGGVVLLVFADLLQLPAEIFICAYVTGDLSPQMVEEGILKGLNDQQHPGMARFVSKAYGVPPQSDHIAS